MLVGSIVHLQQHLPERREALADYFPAPDTLDYFRFIAFFHCFQYELQEVLGLDIFLILRQLIFLILSFYSRDNAPRRAALVKNRLV